AAAGKASAPRFRDDGYHELNQEALKAVFFGDLSEDLADEFLLTTADASLDKETVGQLRAVATQAPPAARTPTVAPKPVLPQSPAVVTLPPASASMRQSTAPPQANAQGGGKRWLLLF